MTINKVLLVEGVDDQHVIWALMGRHQLPETFGIDEKKGVDNLIKTFPVLAKGSGIEAVGIVVDADLDVQTRWAQIRNAALKLGYRNCPESPPSDGLILDELDKPRIGAWIMPDNSLPGMLEDFVSYLIPTGDQLWSYAGQVLAEIPEGLAEFKPVHASKARVHTWLAWKQEPGTPMGLAITKRWLDAAAPSALPFVDWVRRMFS